MNSSNIKRWIGVMVVVIAIVGIAIGVATQTAEAPEESITILTIGTADSGGTMYPVGTAIASVLSETNSNLKINLSASSGSTANAQGLAEGQIDLGLISGDVALCAYSGTDSFEGTALEGLRAIAAVYTSMSNWMVLEESDAIYVHDLVGLTLATGPLDSTTELSARIGLSALGIDTSNSNFMSYSIGTGSSILQTGEIDAIHGFAGVPVSALAELSRQRDTRLLQYTTEELEEILEDNPAYSIVTIPAGTYEGQTEDVLTFGVKCLLCVDVSMDAGLVYEITKIIAETAGGQESANTLMSEMEDVSFLCENLSIPLHSGAQQYYEEQG